MVQTAPANQTTRMMRAALHDLEGQLHTVARIDTVIDTLMFFLVIYLILMFTNLPWWVALIPTAVYCYFHASKNLRIRNLEYVEKRVPSLAEKLRTVRDNLSSQSIMVEKLSIDVLRRFKLVKTSYFIDVEKLAKDILIITALALIIIMISSLNTVFLDFSGVIGQFKENKLVKSTTGTIQKYGGFGAGSGEGAGGGETEDIYGDESIALLGTEELELELAQSPTEININDVKDARSREFETRQASEIGAAADASFNEDIPKENQEIVRNYFNKITRVQ